MIKAIKDFFDSYLIPNVEEEREQLEHSIRLAVVVLLIEIAEADYENAPEERHAILNAIQKQFALNRVSAEQLIALARQEHQESTDYFQFTRLINEHYSAEQKVKVVEAFWRVAFADQALHHYEEHVIRRLADLIHVSHSDFIAAKHRIMNSS
ncbi:MAG: TerB family tellurite resistance protein [Candidatus Thiodiazotropha sp. (ex Lucina aurantia)]|uniref:Tellurite resistance protein TerB n=2 Tax=Candidatus Thiodiazotropha TaxID=1913444 RepID=A0A7Z0VJT7_9GAMM|nr:TerB family tellurite resistance protein [Candidatus Thiodiazotropha endolucinida]MBT3012512.1 TerB family tellurite resistance protein [Candidatus Thiodiazotropha sp. (ex Lucina pensylvanica)]MBT3016851.1 TerB family tellurite resistance protein [Candidatus Thiodiazotropha taylori]MBT3039988.1 TerB family tellurite resistance protein [Candidatus Thiodiazotropha sp. (ex Codakia orbicularis)]MBV2104196.1 TerB family tellurite resistance protein [Candidatus Thiodiazotropha sp. (ex Lucina auran